MSMLSNRQLALIEYMLANPQTPETLCAKACKVPNSTYFNWKAQGFFTAELKRRLKEQWQDKERLATDMMAQLCEQGNFNATKYILDNLGYKPTEKLDVNGDIDINITIEDE